VGDGAAKSGSADACADHPPQRWAMMHVAPQRVHVATLATSATGRALRRGQCRRLRAENRRPGTGSRRVSGPLARTDTTRSKPFQKPESSTLLPAKHFHFSPLGSEAPRHKSVVPQRISSWKHRGPDPALRTGTTRVAAAGTPGRRCVREKRSLRERWSLFLLPLPEIQWAIARSTSSAVMPADMPAAGVKDGRIRPRLR
jgi:hypothetical protein